MDVNSYALKIELQLDFKSVDDSIDDFTKRLQNLEDSIGKSATTSLNYIKGIAAQAADAIKALNAQLSGLDPNLTKIQQIHDLLMKSTGTAQGTTIINASDLADILDKVLSKYFDQEKVLDNREQAYKDINKQTQQLLDIEEDIYDVITQNNNARSKGFDIHHQYNGYKKIQKILYSYIQPFKLMADDIASVVKATEDFITANYRLYDSMHNLMLETKSVSAQIGVTDADAAKLLKTLMHFNLPRKELNAYAVALGKANRYLGVSEVLLSKQFAILNKVGYNVERTDQYMQEFAQTMANTGAVAEDVTSILENQNLSVVQLTRAYGGYNRIGVEVAQRTQQLAIAFRALSKSYGYSPDAITSDLSGIVEQLSDANMKVFAFTGILVNNGETAMEALSVAGDRLRITYDQMKKAQIEGDSISARVYQSVMESMTGLSMDTIDLTMKVKDLQDEHLRATGQQLKFVDALEKARNEIDPYSSSIQSFVKQLNDLYRVLYPLHIAIAAAAEVAMYFLKAINWLIDQSIYLSTQFNNWVEYMEKSGGVYADVAYAIKGIGTALYYTVGTAVLFGGIMLTAGMTLGKFGSMVLGVLKILGGIPAMIAGLITSVGSFITGMVSAISSGMQQIAVAINRFSRTIAKDVGVILATAVAFTLFAGSVYIISQAVVSLAKAGDGVIPTMIALTVAIGAFTAIFVASMIAIATTAGVTAPLLIAAGAAFLMFAGGIALISYGVAELVKSFTGLFDVVLTKLPEIGPTLYGLSQQVFVAGSLLMVGSGMLMVGSITLAAAISSLTIASVLLLATSSVIGVALTGFAYYSDIFSASAKRFYESTVNLVAASVNLKSLINDIDTLTIASTRLAGAANNVISSATVVVGSITGMMLGMASIASGASYSVVMLNSILPAMEYSADRMVAIGYKFGTGTAMFKYAIDNLKLVSLAVSYVAKSTFDSSILFQSAMATLDKTTSSMFNVSIKLAAVSVLFYSSIGTFGYISERFASASTTIYNSARDFNNSSSEIIKGIDGIVLASSKLSDINTPLSDFRSSIVSLVDLDTDKFIRNMKSIADGFKYIKDIDAEAVSNTVTISAAISKFEDPVLKLSAAVDKLHQSIIMLDDNSIFNSDINKVVDITSSDRSNVANAIKTTPIQNVVVNVKKEESIDINNETMAINREMLNAMTSISSVLAMMSTADNAGEILSLLKSYMPLLATDNRALPNHFNSWS